MSPLRQRLSQPVNGYGLVAVLLSCIGLVVASFVISLTVARGSARQYCDIVVAQTDSYRQTPPITDSGKAVARRMEALRTKLECPKEE